MAAITAFGVSFIRVGRNFVESPSNASVNSKHQHPPGQNPRQRFLSVNFQPQGKRKV